MTLSVIAPIVLIATPVVAQSIAPVDATQWLVSLIANGPLAAILAWMLYTQQQDRVADRRRSDDLVDVMRGQGIKMDRLARSILVLSLHLGSAERGSVNPAATAEAKEILRELGEQTAR